MNSYRQQYSSLSSSYHQDLLPKNNIGLSNRYGSIDRLASSNHRKPSFNNFSSNAFAAKRSTSYGSGTKLNDNIGTLSLRRHDNDHIPAYERRTSYASSHYSTSGYASSYGTLPRYNRSQTPSYLNRERNYASNREYKSMSRFSTDRDDKEEGEEVLPLDESELKDVLRDISKLNEQDMIEDDELKTPRCSKEKEILSICATNSIASNSAPIVIGFASFSI
ncbi:hypothetical protein ACH3XW_17055 [Acanthocheilonema viteae]